jgi:hypothetical protein
VVELPEQAAAVGLAGWAAYFEAAGHLVHFHRLLDHQVAKEALPRRWKVRILAQAKKIRCIAVRCLANMRNMQNMTNMTNMFNMTNMTNMNPPFQICKTIGQICIFDILCIFLYCVCVRLKKNGKDAKEISLIGQGFQGYLEHLFWYLPFTTAKQAHDMLTKKRRYQTNIGS